MYFQRIIMIVVVLSVLFPLVIKGRQTAKTAGLTPLSMSSTAGTIVQVSGDVKHPGIYILSDNKMTDSVIFMSMPLCEGSFISLSTCPLPPVHTGSRLHIDCKSPDNRALISYGTMKSSQLLTLGLPLDLNQMTTDDLELLPGIGPSLARRIIECRQKNGDYEMLSDLIQVEGIGEKKFKQLSGYFKSPIIRDK